MKGEKYRVANINKEPNCTYIKKIYNFPQLQLQKLNLVDASYTVDFW